MSQFFNKVKNLSQKAAEIKAAMQQVPPKVAEFREAVATTAGQLQQLKAEVQSSVADLKADNEQRISQALQEIAASRQVFEDAGYELAGVDLEISPVHRLIVHLNKTDEASESALRALLTVHQHRRTVHALLSALLQAQPVAESVDLGPLNYCEVIVSVGPIPSVRLCWRATAVAVAMPTMPVVATSAPIAVSQPAAVSPTASPFGPGSFFEQRSPRPQASSVPVAAVPLETPEAAAGMAGKSSFDAEAETPKASGWGADTLARFKKMPDFSKPRK